AWNWPRRPSPARPIRTRRLSEGMRLQEYRRNRRSAHAGALIRGPKAKMHFCINRNRPPTSDGMARLSETPPRGARSRPKAKKAFFSRQESPAYWHGMARLSETPARGARSRPKAKCILLSAGIARLLATEWPASPRRRLAALVRGQRPKCISLSTEIARLLATEWPASRTRRLAALVRGRRPNAFFSKNILLSTGIARSLATESPASP